MKENVDMKQLQSEVMMPKLPLKAAVNVMASTFGSVLTNHHIHQKSNTTQIQALQHKEGENR